MFARKLLFVVWIWPTLRINAISTQDKTDVKELENVASRTGYEPEGKIVRFPSRNSGEKSSSSSHTRQYSIPPSVYDADPSGLGHYAGDYGNANTYGLSAPTDVHYHEHHQHHIDSSLGDYSGGGGLAHYGHHGISLKGILLPLAGVALLGAAAALVSNPVLLQLGVISGRRRRRRFAANPPTVPHNGPAYPQNPYMARQGTMRRDFRPLL